MKTVMLLICLVLFMGCAHTTDEKIEALNKRVDGFFKNGTDYCTFLELDAKEAWGVELIQKNSGKEVKKTWLYACFEWEE